MSERAQIVLQFAIVVVVLAAAVYGIVGSARARPPGAAVASAGPDASLIAETLRSPSPSVRATATPSPAQAIVTLPPSAVPTPTRRPIATTPYAFGGRRYTGVVLGRGWTITAPFDGQLELHVYQLINGEIREGADAPGAPSYPYVIVTAADGRRLTYRPGALRSDTELVADRTPVRSGNDLFRVIGDGASSWHDFYDPSVGAQIIVSLVGPSGTDLDAAPLIRAR